MPTAWPALRLADIVENIDRIMEFTRDLDRSEMASSKLRNAAARTKDELWGTIAQTLDTFHAMSAKTTPLQPNMVRD